MKHFDAGFIAGQADAAALRLDRPNRFRSRLAREGYRQGYESSRCVAVDIVSLAHSKRHDEINFHVTASDFLVTAGGRQELSMFAVSIRCRNSRWQFSVSDRFYARFGIYVKAWVRRLWNSLPAHYQGMTSTLMFSLSGERAATRKALDDYFLDHDSPLAGFAARAWTWHLSWPLYPESLPFPQDDGVIPGIYSGMAHWCVPVVSPFPSTIACDPRCSPRPIEAWTTATAAYAPCCPTCYRMRPLPLPSVGLVG